MLKLKISRRLYLFIFLIFITEGFRSLIAQPVVAVDNWFNKETDAKTAKPYHYLWTDKQFSGYSQWGEIFSAHGCRLETLGRPDKKSLGKVDIFIIVDPDTTSENPVPNYIEDDDIKIITAWVKQGGVLAVFANDAPNCEFSHLNRLMKVFGMKFNHVTLHRVDGTDFEMGACKELPAHILFREVRKIYIKEVSDISLSGNAKSILTEKGKVLIAETKFGKGYVFAIGDPWIYNEYIGHERLPESFDNHKAAENLSGLLLSHIKK